MNNLVTPKSGAVLTTNGNGEPAWGKANPFRGAKSHDMAAQFVADHPVGTKMSQEVFSDWLATHGYDIRIPQNADKKSDQWLAYLQRRHRFRYDLNKAAMHPRMTDQGLPPFVLESIGPDILEVRAIYVAITRSKIPERLANLGRTKRRQLAYLMQSEDWTGLPAYEKAFAETIYDDIDAWIEDTERNADRISRKFSKLEYKLKALNIAFPNNVIDVDAPDDLPPDRPLLTYGEGGDH